LTGDGNLTVTDTFNWFAGNLDGRNFAETAALTIAQDATLHITGDETKGLRGRDIFVEGSMIWEGTGNLVVMWGTLLEIGSDAEFDIRTDATITRTNGTLDIENNGLIVKSEGSGTTAFNYPYGGFHNLGSVRVEIGTLMLNNANSSFNASGDGDFEIVSGATLRFKIGRASCRDRVEITVLAVA